MAQPPSQRRSTPAQWATTVVVLLVSYVLSSGPVLGLAFRLREETGWDGFYSIMYLYAPLLVVGFDNPIFWYIEWWVVEVFDTVGPG